MKKRQLLKIIILILIWTVFSPIHFHASADQLTPWISHVKWSADGSFWAIGYNDNLTVEIQSVPTGQTIRVLKIAGYNDFDWRPFPNPEQLAVGDLFGNIWVYNASTGEVVARAEDHTDSQITAIAWSPDGTKLASGHIECCQTGESARGKVKIWDLIPLEQPVSPPETSAAFYFHHVATFERWLQLYQVEQVSWSPDGSRIASTGTSDINIWHVASGEREASLEINDARLAVWSPDGTKLITSGLGFFVQVRDGNTYQLLSEIDSRDNASAIAWRPDGQRIAILLGNTLRVVDSNTYQVLYESPRSEIFLGGVAWSPDGSRLVYGNGSTLQVELYIATINGTPRLAKIQETPHSRYRAKVCPGVTAQELRQWFYPVLIAIHPLLRNHDGWGCMSPGGLPSLQNRGRAADRHRAARSLRDDAPLCAWHHAAQGRRAGAGFGGVGSVARGGVRCERNDTPHPAFDSTSPVY